MSSLSEFLSQIDIVTVAEWLDLSPVGASGGRAKILCPIHGEKTPSCMLYEDGHFYCFGCQAKGSQIDLVMETLGYPFGQALDYLAEQSGLPRPAQDPAAAARSAALRKAMTAFREEIDEADDAELPAGIDREAATALGLGRCPTDPEQLAEIASTIIDIEQLERWAGHFTIELHSRGGLAGFAALIPESEDDDPLAIEAGENGEVRYRLSRAEGMRGIAFAGRTMAGKSIRQYGAVALTTDIDEMLRLVAAGRRDVICTAAPIDEAIAGGVAEMAGRVIVLVTPAGRSEPTFMPGLLELTKTGVRVEMAPVTADFAVGAPVPLFGYIAATAARRDDERRRAALLRMYLDAVRSASTREIYGAELRRRGLLSA